MNKHGESLKVNNEDGQGLPKSAAILPQLCEFAPIAALELR
jgi:hypothetical protein